MTTGRLQHLVGRRRVLDQLIERRLPDHLARCRREVAPDLEHARLGLRHLPGRNVLQHVGEALEKVLAARLDRPLQHLRIGQREVRRAHRVDEAPGREAQLLARCRIHALDLVDRAEQLVRHAQIGLADGVEERVLAPFGRCEAPVLPVRLPRLGRSGHSAQHLAPGLEPLGPGLSTGAHQGHRIGRGAAHRRSRTRAATRRGTAGPSSGFRPRIPSASAGRGPSPASSAASPRASESRSPLSFRPPCSRLYAC